MSNEKQDQPAERIEDLEVEDDSAADVTGGDGTAQPLSNILKTKHDTVKNSINNVR